MAEWKKVKLGDVAELNYGTGLREDRRLGGKIPVYSSSGIIGWHNVPLVDSEGIIIGRKGTAGSVFYSNKPFFAIDTTYFIQKNDLKYDLKFLYYLLLTLRLDRLNEDSAVPGLNRNNAYSQEFLFPDISTQHRIASILSAFDDKIELLRQQNKTLEKIAQCYFNKLMSEEEGEESNLDEIANFLNGLPLQKYPSKNDRDFLPVIKIRELRQGVTENTDKASKNIPKEFIINDGDIIFSWSGSLEVIIWCGGEGALNQHLFKVTSNKYPKWFYYFWLKYHLRSFQQIALSKATTMGHIQRHHLKEAIVYIPNESEINKYDLLLTPTLEKIILNQQQIRTLSQQRDLLLPQLMSGKIDVEDF